MRHDRSLALFLVAAAFAPLMPKPTQAAVPYAAFAPTQSDIDARFSETYRECRAKAVLSKAAQEQCDIDAQRTLPREVEEKYRAVLSRLTGQEARALRTGQQSWRRLYRQNCLAFYENKTDANLVGLVRTCFNNQNIKRILWLETFN